jgi:hypothetical protein
MAILRSAFPATVNYQAYDLRDQLSRLHTTLTLTAPERAREMETRVAAVLAPLITATPTAPVDGVTADGVNPKITSPEFRDFSREAEISIDFISAHEGAEVLEDVAAQIQFLLDQRNWTFAAPT